MTLVYIGIGSNLGDREGNIRRAMELLDGRPGVRVLRVSSLHETEPVDIGETEPMDFLNAAAEVETDLPQRELLPMLKEIERKLGRESSRDRGESEGRRKYRSRPIDLDILLFGDQVIREPGLEVPHGDLTERLFVLDPLAELCPDRLIPGTGKSVKDFQQALKRRDS